MSSSVSKVNIKKAPRSSRSKKTTEIIVEEVKPVVVDGKAIDNVEEVIKEDKKETKKDIKEEIKEEVKEEVKEEKEKKEEAKGGKKPKKSAPPIFTKRNEIVGYIVKQEEFKGFRAPVNKLLSWIIREHIEASEGDKFKQLDLAKVYYDKHKKECHDKFEEFRSMSKQTEKKHKEEIEPGHYLIIYKSGDGYSYATVKHTGVNGNINKHKNNGYELIKRVKVEDDYKFKTDEKVKDYVNIKTNKFTMKEDKDFEDFIKLF